MTAASVPAASSVALATVRRPRGIEACIENAEEEHTPAVAATRIFINAMVVVLYLLTRRASKLMLAFTKFSTADVMHKIRHSGPGQKFSEMNWK